MWKQKGCHLFDLIVVLLWPVVENFSFEIIGLGDAGRPGWNPRPPSDFGKNIPKISHPQMPIFS